MITRRDKLLKNPWEQRKYENHLRKINSAVPVIDNRPPISRQHVAVKLKKRQMEIERMRQIENDNLILLRRINYVMNTNRVDNWNIPPQQTKYLNRVPLSTPSLSRLCSQSACSLHADIRKQHSLNSGDAQMDRNHNHLRKSKCLACSPHTYAPKREESERIPWEEPKMWSKTMEMPRERSKSLPVIKTNEKTSHNESTSDSVKIKCASSKGRLSLTKDDNVARKLQKQISLDNDKSEVRGSSALAAQRLVISSGSLKLCVKFPSDSHITLKNGVTEKTVFGNQHLCRFK